jgi:hypothetical protein
MELDEPDDEIVALIVQLSEQARSSAIVIESCSRSVREIKWDIQQAGEKADAALETAVEGDEETRLLQVAALREVLEDERVVLRECQKKLASRKPLFMKRLLVESALQRTESLLTQAEQYQ